MLTMVKHLMNVWREVWDAVNIEWVESSSTKEAKQTRLCFVSGEHFRVFCLVLFFPDFRPPFEYDSPGFPPIMTRDKRLGSLMMVLVTPLGGLSVVDKDRIRSGYFLFPLFHGLCGWRF